MPILPGIDGERKMSKSYGNYIGVTEPPEEIYGKTLRLPDGALGQWYELLAGGPPPADVGPRDAKRALARTLVARFHDAAAASAAEEAFDRVHREHKPPEEMPDVALPANGDGPAGDAVHLPALLAEAFGVSRSEARRSLEQGGVRLDGEPLPAQPLDRTVDELDGRVLQLGKRRFARLRRG
jgi:tyrosyl-tRNA synthetase